MRTVVQTCRKRWRCTAIAAARCGSPRAGQISQFVNGRFVPVDVPDVDSQKPRDGAHDGRAEQRSGSARRCKGVMTWDGKSVSTFEGKSRPRRSSACQSIYTDSQGRVWIGLLSGGVAVYDNGTFRSFGPTRRAHRGDRPLDPRGRQRRRLVRARPPASAAIQNGHVTAITQDNAPLKDLVPVLIEDLEGQIWVGVNSGAAVIRFHPSEVDKVAANPTYQLEYALYDETDGMQHGSQTWQSGCRRRSRRRRTLWVATGLGMTVIDPRQSSADRIGRRRRASRSVTADGRRVAPDRDLSLPSGTSTLRIEFGTVSLSSASKLRFRYMLEGVDDDWVYAGNAREAAYIERAVGDYRFSVSTTANGEWTEAARWEFSVAPPFYRTREFMTLSLLGLSLFLGAAWWLRLRAVRQSVRAGVCRTRAGQPRDSRHAASESRGHRRRARNDCHRAR